MKKILLLMSLVWVATAIQAATITPSQALGLAQDLRSKSISANRTLATTSKISTKLVHTAKSPTGDTDFYVFNYSSNNGFVIVAGDDIIPPIIGYAEVGAFNKLDIPENMQGWLQEMQNEIEYVKQHPEHARKAPISSKNEVKPLLTSIWSQGAPFNNLCPMFDSNTHYVTGCVATAVAQIMYYHKWPDRGTGSHSYTSSAKGFELSADFSQSEYDWDNMIDNYNTGSNSAEANYAVAKLMSDVGISVNMNYGYQNKNLSGAQSWMVPNALRDYFKYDKSIKSHSRSSYKDAEAWEKLIRDELNEARPVYYSGFRTGGYGHAFVCDGYNTDGHFHINWGWGGSSNGYFLLAVSDDNDITHFNYTQNQSVITHIMPATVPIMLPADKRSIDRSEFKAEWTYPWDESLVDSYTLLVKKTNQCKLMEEADFSHLTRLVNPSGTMTNVHAESNKYLPEGWTSGTSLYVDNEHIMLGNSITSKQYDFTGYNEATLELTGRDFHSNYSPCTFSVAINGTTVTENYHLSSDNDIVIRIKIPCKDKALASFTINGKNFPCFSNIKIYAGDATDPEITRVKAPSETGDETSRTITGITNKNYTLKGLLPEEEYGYKVKAIFTDGRESPWSNMEYVQLKAQPNFETDFSYRSRFDVKTHQNSYKNTLAIAAGIESADYTIYRTPNSLNHSSEFDSTPVEVASLRVSLSSTGTGQYAIYYNDPMDEREDYRFDNERLSFGGILHGHPDELINIYDYFTEEVIANENKRAASYTYSISKYESKFKEWSTPKDFATVPVYSGELSTPAYSPEYTIADLSIDKNRSLPVTDKATVSIMDYQNDDISASDMRKVNYRFYKGNEIVFKGTTTATISIPENAGDYTGEFCVTSPWGENTYGTAKVNVASIDVDVECPEFGWIYFGTDFNKRAYITDMVIKPQIVADNKPYVYYYNVWRGDEDAESLVRLNELSEMSVNGWTTNYAAIKNNYPIGNSTTDKLEVVDIYIDDAINRGQTLINSGIVRMYYTPNGKSGRPLPSQKMYIFEKYMLLEVYEDGMIKSACDVNNDGCLDVTDVSELINQITGINSSPFNTKKGDIDNNGTLDVTDVTLLINKIIK